MYERITHYVGDDCPGGHMEIDTEQMRTVEGYSTAIVLLREAADEIDRLREAMQTIVDRGIQCDACGHVERVSR